MSNFFIFVRFNPLILQIEIRDFSDGPVHTFVLTYTYFSYGNEGEYTCKVRYNSTTKYEKTTVAYKLGMSSGERYGFYL